MTRALDFALPREKEFGIPLLADAQLLRPARNKSRQSVYLRIPRERETKISPTRHSAALLGVVSFADENDRASQNAPAAHAHPLFHNLAYRH